MADNVDLAAFNRGDTWTNRFTFTDTAGDPIDISGRVYWLTLKLDPEASDGNADAQISVTASGSDAVNGVVYLTLPPTVTEGLLPANYYYDVQEVADASTVTTIMYGRVRVDRDITRSR